MRVTPDEWGDFHQMYQLIKITVRDMTLKRGK